MEGNHDLRMRDTGLSNKQAMKGGRKSNTAKAATSQSDGQQR